MLLRSLVSVLAFESAALAADYYPITGIFSAQGQRVSARRDINELQAEAGPQWDLYIQALAAMQNMNARDPLSFFQIGGIHGLPTYPWNGTVQGNSNAQWPGYCVHSVAMFLTWHRPYVLLFEQSLVNQARAIATRYPASTRARYMQAAETLRTPYWDWASDLSVPNSTALRTIPINTPRGRTSFKNPLAAYSYPREALDGAFGEFTDRRPPPPDRIGRCESGSYPQSANRRLRQGNLRERVYRAFIDSPNLRNFSHAIEDVHGAVHIAAACGGAMGSLQYAGFDPLFMLHHANVDRLYAFWQAANPTLSRITQRYRVQRSRYTTPEGAWEGPDTPLLPFYRTRNQSHTHNTVVSTFNLGYTYTGLEQGRANGLRKRNKSEDGMVPSELVLRDLQSSVNQALPAANHHKYKNAGYGHKNAGYGPPQTSSQSSYGANASHYSPSESLYHRAREILGDLYSSTAHLKRQTVYQALVHFDKEELPELPAIIDVFLCDFHIGEIALLDDPSSGIHTTRLPLNEAIAECNRKGIKPGQYGEDMSVKIITSSGMEVPLAGLKTMSMDVELCTETPTSDDDFPSISDRHSHPGRLKQFIKKQLKEKIREFGVVRHGSGYGGHRHGSGYGGQRQGSGYGGQRQGSGYGGQQQGSGYDDDGW
ncbi:hypothetical protein HIM_11709 [Hirsutella minnesotensis 3608]|uniref:Tyrosinase copper-binding domain-containing protein n=1 Tax=Hirsutella minnesotensis 3608 TaxID=1043627 RepID=A0A0F7ZWF9_9HYPO|nr:hypothetical protein HIM_11709 [Hirsutella minnesotensis 3608]